MENARTPQEELEVKNRSKKMLLYIGIFSIVMLFGAFTSAYIVSQADNFWVKMKLPSGFYISTAILLASSATVYLSLRAARANDGKMAKNYLWVTLALGLAFAAFQFQAWKQMYASGNYVVANILDLKGEYGTDYTFLYKGEPLELVDGEFYQTSDVVRASPLNDRLFSSRNANSSYIYLISGLHLIHLAGGLIAILIAIFVARKKPYSSTNTLRLELCGTYWHFLDGLWIYLLLFLLFIH